MITILIVIVVVPRCMAYLPSPSFGCPHCGFPLCGQVAALVSYHHNEDKDDDDYCRLSLLPDLEFVATVATGGRVKFLSAV